MTTIERTASAEFLWLEITGKCQLACTHCYADSGPDGGHGAMFTADWRGVIDEAAILGVRTVQFIGGEPTLHPDLVELIEHALWSGLGVEVFSNLVHVTPRQWAVFERPGVTLATSYYSDDPAEHRRITGRPVLARTRANIAEARKRGIPLRAGVIELDDEQRSEQARAELRELGIAEIGGDRLRQIGRGAGGGEDSAEQLCGGCADRVAAIGPDGGVRSCVFTRWGAPLGDVRERGLAGLIEELPSAREALLEQGMPERPARGAGCKPGECFPID